MVSEADAQGTTKTKLVLSRHNVSYQNPSLRIEGVEPIVGVHSRIFHITLVVVKVVVCRVIILFFSAIHESFDDRHGSVASVYTAADKSPPLTPLGNLASSPENVLVALVLRHDARSGGEGVIDLPGGPRHVSRRRQPRMRNSRKPTTAGPLDQTHLNNNSRES